MGDALSIWSKVTWIFFHVSQELPSFVSIKVTSSWRGKGEQLWSRASRWPKGTKMWTANTHLGPIIDIAQILKKPFYTILLIKGDIIWPGIQAHTTDTAYRCKLWPKVSPGLKQISWTQTIELAQRNSFQTEVDSKQVQQVACYSPPT